MSVQANKKSITAFVIGALAVGFVMVLTFGGSDAFTRHEAFVLYFNGSVNGLDSTSLVKFRGVPIGYVDSLKLHYNQLPGDRRVPVMVKVDVERLRRQLNLVADLGDPAVLEEQVKAGLRGKLEVDSYISGKTYVDLGYYPNAPKPPIEAFEALVPVIPTIQSNSSQYITHVVTWTNTLGQFDYHALEAKINDMVDQATNKVMAIPFDRYSQKVLDTLAPLEALNQSAWSRQLAQVVALTEKYRAGVGVQGGAVMKESANLIGLSEEARTGLDKFQAQMETLRSSLQPGGAGRQELDQMLLQTTSLARSLRQQATAVEEQPAVVAK